METKQVIYKPESDFGALAWRYIEGKDTPSQDHYQLSFRAWNLAGTDIEILIEQENEDFYWEVKCNIPLEISSWSEILIKLKTYNQNSDIEECLIDSFGTDYAAIHAVELALMEYLDHNTPNEKISKEKKYELMYLIARAYPKEWFYYFSSAEDWERYFAEEDGDEEDDD